MALMYFTNDMINKDITEPIILFSELWFKYNSPDYIV